MSNEIREKVELSKKAFKSIISISEKDKNKYLLSLSDRLVKAKKYILLENEKDVKYARENGIKESLIDRLLLTEERIHSMAVSIQEIVALPDPIGEVIEGWRRPNGLYIEKIRTPIGVIAIIYEARPNVTIDSLALSFKAGNVVILKGGSLAINSNIALVKIAKDVAADVGVSPDIVNLIESTRREDIIPLLKMNDLIDLVIPRGGHGLIRTVVENSSIPVIQTGVGNCHIFVDKTADLERAVDVVINAKTQRPGTCNAVEKLLVHKDIAQEFLPNVISALKRHHVEVRGDKIVQGIVPDVVPANEEDWETEYLDLIIGIKVVEGVDEAIEHITRYGTKHSESILTNSYENAEKFIHSI
ncbi:MAG TPA: glutamate-5-semialdehyde dehydrogenase, partial [Candidatus Atribacteria bacterium]|nr:glutamate-5-semialdehyde dehydrogenase [Candidatus Atribacteria bacterium]